MRSPIKLASGIVSATTLQVLLLLAAGLMFKPFWLFGVVGGEGVAAYFERYLMASVAGIIVVLASIWVATRGEQDTASVRLRAGVIVCSIFWCVMMLFATAIQMGAGSQAYRMELNAAKIEKAVPGSPVAARLRAALRSPDAFESTVPWHKQLDVSDTEFGLVALERASVAAALKNIDPRIAEVVTRVRREGVMTGEDRVLIVTVILDAPPEAVAHLNTAALVARLQR